MALGTRERLSRVLLVREWEALYDEAERQAIVGVLLGGLEHLPDEQLPSLELKLQWIGLVQIMEAEYRLHVERTWELAERFRTVGFRSCVLKGVAMARYYPEPSRRQCGDIDLWTFPVKGERLEVRAYSVTKFRRNVMKWLRSQYEIDHNVWHNVGVKVFEDVPVEIHFHPGWLWNPWNNRKLQKFFEKYTSYIFHHTADIGYNVMPVEFDAVFSLVHTYRHLIVGGVGLRHVVDYYYVLKQVKGGRFGGSEDILHQTSYILHQLGMQRFVSGMMWVMKEVCGASDELLLCKPNEKEGIFLLSEIMEGGNFGQKRKDGKFRNSFSRWMMMVKHYPSEMLWMIPWKIWHKGWRLIYG